MHLADPLGARLVDLGRALRTHGVNVGTSEVADAAAATSALGLEDRERLRSGLAATMMRRSADRTVFDQLFDIYFPPAVGGRTGEAEEPAPTDTAGARERAVAIREELIDALARGDDRELERLAARAVLELGRLPDADNSSGFFAKQTIERLAPQTAIAAAQERSRESRNPSVGGEDAAGGSGQRREVLSDRYDREEIRGRVGAFRRKIEAEAARRNAELRGRDRISQFNVEGPLERVDIMLTSGTDAGDLQAVIAPLSRKLASKLAARQRRHTRGAIDIRRTLRAAMSTGGVPVRPAHKRRTRTRAELVLLCDMSGSVAGFSRFTMLLLQSLAGVFRRVRFIGFINVCDDINDLVRDSQVGEEIAERVTQEANMARHHSASDYGSAFADAADRYIDLIGPRSTVLVIGDARSNGTNPQFDALRTLVQQAGHAAWLNPEPLSQWRMGDSVAEQYGEIIDMHEVRNIDQLREFISRLPLR